MAKQTLISCLLFSIYLLFVSSQVKAANKDSLSIFPKTTEVREVSSLDGVWHFCLTNRTFDLIARKNKFEFESWFSRPLETINCGNDYERMPVPSSFNDITTRREIRDFNGWVLYGRTFYVPKSWLNTGNKNSILLRFGSVNYQAVVYVNGRHAVNHTGGHLPFQVDITQLLFSESKENFITVAVNNVLSNITLPQGQVIFKNDTRKSGKIFSESKPQFDFFNYAGIHRSVYLYSVPRQFRITDVLVRTSTSGNQNNVGVVEWKVETNVPLASEVYLKVSLHDKNGFSVAESISDAQGTFKVANAQLWWPFTMSPTPGYQYRLSVMLFENNQVLNNELRSLVKEDRLIDSVYLKVGIRNLTLTKKEFLINGKPIYFRGFGRHEDSAIRGRSLDLAVILRDFSLMKWMGANSFRTSHYPYSEEVMDEADEQGFLVFNEVPAVGLGPYLPEVLKQHLETIRELIDRDKNRPSVVAWSIANEPQKKPEAREYFAKVAAEARRADSFSKRPITAALANNAIEPYIAPSLDLILINRYYAWYGDPGYIQVIQGYLIGDLRRHYQKYGKLLVISEYGADTLVGMHSEPATMFSEDFQVEYLVENHKAFDVLKAEGILHGEHIWNFADFMTSQGITRVGGNKKGIFTRDRQPKTAARMLRCRYWALSGDVDNVHREGFSLCPQMVY